MLHMMLHPIVSSYLNQNGRFYARNGSPLLLSNRKSYRGHYDYHLCITITNAELDFSCLQLNHAVLILPIQNISSSCGYFNNVLSISARSLSSNGTSYFTTAFSLPISNASIVCNTLQADITELINEWDYANFPTLEVFLSLNIPNLSLQIWNHPTLSVELILECIRYPVVPPSPEPSGPSMISLSSKNNSCAILGSNETIPFDTIVDGLSKNIAYNMNTHSICFTKPGCYYLEWIINLRGCTTIDCICIGIINNYTGEIHDFHTPNTIPLQLCGQHILHVPDSTPHYSLINLCDSPIQLSHSYTQASLVIFKI